jgi:hypothetical protein
VADEDQQAEKASKPKRVVSQATLDMLAAGRAKREENRKSAAAAKITTEGGQELVLVDREQMRKPEPPPAERPRPRNIDDVVNKLREREGDEPMPNLYPSVEEVAQRAEIYGAGGAIPPTEIDPMKREKPTMGRVDFTEDAPPDLSSAKVRTLADILARFPVGDGQYEIQVVRRAPNAWGGFQCKGQQRPIREYLTDAQFVELYGGGEYLLTVFGPPPRGGIMDPQTRRMRPKALTEPVPYAVPLIYPPNPEACVFEEHEEDDGQGYYDDGEETEMRFQPQFQQARTGRPNTPADAKVLEVQIGATERAEARVRERERELTEQIQNSHKDVVPLANNAIGAVQDSAARMQEVLQRQAEAAEARADREREAAEARRNEQQRPDPSAAMAAKTMDRMVDMLTQRAPEQGAELARLAQQYAAERENMQSAHARELERVQGHANDSVRIANERTDSRVREIESRCDERIKNAEAAAAREVQMAREASTREKSDIERIFNSRLADEQRNHERELRAKDDSYGSRAEVQKTAFEMRIAQKDDEIRRLSGDAERFRTEAEKNRDLPARMQEFAVAAEAMGFAKDGGGTAEPASWKELAGQVGLQLVAKLPEIVQSAGEAVRGARPDLSQQAQMQQMQEAAQHTQPRRLIPPLPTRSGQPFGGGGRMIFNTEDGPGFHDLAPNLEGSYIAPRDPQPPISEPGMAPSGLQVQYPPMVNPGSPPAYVYPPEPQQQAQPMWQAAPQQPAAPAPRPQVQRPAAPVPPASAGEAISAEQIMALAPVVEQAYSGKQPPDVLAAAMVEQLGKPAAAAIASALSVERVVATVMQHNPSSALVRRDGQKYLKAVWAAVKAQAA